MLTSKPNKGDCVVISRTYVPKFDQKPVEAIVESVGRKFIYAGGYKFDFEGVDCTNDPRVLELWNSLEAYENAKKRDRLISLIKQTVGDWRFGKDVSTENLEEIAVLLERSQCLK